MIENLGSHGVGRALHEAPEHIPGYFDPTDKRVLKDGMVITIEPFLSTKSRVVTETYALELAQRTGSAALGQVEQAYVARTTARESYKRAMDACHDTSVVLHFEGQSQ